MEVPEAIAFWNMKAKNEDDYACFMKSRIQNEMNCLSSTKSELYDLVYLHDNGNIEKKLFTRGNECVTIINKCLISLLELCELLKEKNIKSKEMTIPVEFIMNYKKGFYDKLHNELCSFTENKIYEGKNIENYLEESLI